MPSKYSRTFTLVNLKGSFSLWTFFPLCVHPIRERFSLQHCLDHRTEQSPSTAIILRLTHLGSHWITLCSMEKTIYLGLKTKDVTMDSKIGIGYACIHVRHCEEQMFSSYAGPTPVLYKRYWYIYDIVWLMEGTHSDLEQIINFIKLSAIPLFYTSYLKHFSELSRYLSLLTLITLPPTSWTFTTNPTTPTITFSTRLAICPVVRTLFLIPNSIVFAEYAVMTYVNFFCINNMPTFDVHTQNVVRKHQNIYTLYRWPLARYNWPHSFSCAARCCKRQISCHNKRYIWIATPYRRSSNTSRILTLVRYYAVITARCGKLCM